MIAVLSAGGVSLAIVRRGGSLSEWCQRKVVATLVAPATARLVDDKTATSSGEFYIASGSVDSQNSYGAFIRSSFQCYAIRRGNTWELRRMTVGDDTFGVAESDLEDACIQRFLDSAAGRAWMAVDLSSKERFTAVCADDVFNDWSNLKPPAQT